MFGPKFNQYVGFKCHLLFKYSRGFIKKTTNPKEWHCCKGMFWNEQIYIYIYSLYIYMLVWVWSSEKRVMRHNNYEDVLIETWGKLLQIAPYDEGNVDTPNGSNKPSLPSTAGNVSIIKWKCKSSKSNSSGIIRISSQQLTCHCFCGNHFVFFGGGSHKRMFRVNPY